MASELKIEDAMCAPTFYGLSVSDVKRIETHVSWVFLSGQWAYKIKKAVKNSFLDFSTLEKRKHYCEAELAINKRWAPDLYDSVVPIFRTPQGFNLEVGETVEYAVRMRQFPQTALLLKMIEAGELTSEQVEILGSELARIHTGLPRLDPAKPWATTTRIHTDASDNFRDLIQQFPADFHPQIRELEDWSDETCRRLEATFANRRTGGMIRECHGDLHLGNLIFLDGRVQLFDGIEFNDSFRWIDVASDLSFVLMDLEEHQRWDLANRLLNRYLEATGDYEALQVLPFYKMYRAMVRAKTSILNANQHDPMEPLAKSLLQSAVAYLDYGKRLVSTRRPFLVITHGVSGSGKSHGTKRLLDLPNLIRIRSDVERKRIFGLPIFEAIEIQKVPEVYSAVATQRTYNFVVDITQRLLSSGYSVVVDATFLKQWQREMFGKLATKSQVKFWIVEFHADVKTLQTRIQSRVACGTDPSDATVDVLAAQLQEIESLTPWEQSRCNSVDAILLAESGN